jgi:hypothetical protein
VPTSVVNMIPNGLSGEANQDSEPMVAVNLSNPQQIAGSAFTPDPANGPNAPIYVSTDGGNTWVLNTIVPSNPATGDICLRFGTQGNRLYIGILQQPFGLRMNILRTNNFTAAGAATLLVDRGPGPNVDQPFVQAATVMAGAGVGNDRVYVGNNDFATAPNTATVDVSLNGGAATPPPPANFNARRLDTRATTVNQDSPHIRPAVHLDGTVYAIYAARTAVSGTIRTCNVVVVRDDNWAAGGTQFNDLLDSGDGQRGQIVVTGVNVVWNAGAAFGQERLGGNVAIAVDPRNSSNVYVAWADNAGALSTLHVRRSQNRGQAWSGDLRVITGAINPALAINSRGRVCFMYQQLTGTAPNQRWETHIELTDNDWSSVNNRILSNTPANAPVRVFGPYLGDYIGLMAVGKDFCGAFCANNTPNAANFPQGVVFQRNVNMATQTLLANDGVTAVPASIDPFFVKETLLTADADFYVRDWTDSPTSGDSGLEPSTHPVFYATSDVWNRRKKHDPGGFNANDQPINEYPKMGPGQSGKNFGFVRIRRNAGGSAATVTAHFLVSPFGTGSVYQNAGTDPDLSVAFGSGDLVKTPTPGYEWHLGPTMTDHVCFAVEITAPGDPIVAPSLLGHAPGWPSTDLMVLNDNNKAQRNMYPPPSSGSGSESSFAIIRNAATFTRDLVLRYNVDPVVFKRLGRIGIGIVGERGVKRSREGELILAKMAPGERRWLTLTTEARTGDGRMPLPIDFYELAGTAAVNGFAIAPTPSPPAAAIRWNTELHMFRFGRLAEAFGVAEAKRQSAGARGLVRRASIAPAAYLRFLRDHQDGVRVCIDSLVSRAGSDPFALRAAVRRLGEAIAAKSSDKALPAHATLLNALDVFQTMLQLEGGDPACVLHNVEWQRDLYTRVARLAKLPAAAAIVKASDQFARGYGERKFGWEQFPRHVRRVLPALRETAEAFPRLRLRAPLETLEKSLGSVAAAQHAHREFLLALAALE